MSYRSHRKERSKQYDDEIERLIKSLINQYCTYGYRRITVMLKKILQVRINRKKVQRIFQKNGWQVKKRDYKAKPRVEKRRSRASDSNIRWAMDLTHVNCGSDGWGHLTAVIDCHDRELIGYEFALRGRSKEAVRAIESACIERFGTIHPQGKVPVLRSDNGLVFQSRAFRMACGNYGLQQEFITPYTPEQNGIIERFFRSLKEECAWQHKFRNFEDARRAISKWIEYYNTERPHQALGYLSPKEFRLKKGQQVA